MMCSQRMRDTIDLKRPHSHLFRGDDVRVGIVEEHHGIRRYAKPIKGRSIDTWIGFAAPDLVRRDRDLKEFCDTEIVHVAFPMHLIGIAQSGETKPRSQ